MPIWMDVNPRSGVPIYVQIVDQVKHGLRVGTLRSGEKLPTVRELSSELTVAPTTVVKAYEKLQGMGLVTSRAGVGTVVVPGVEDALREELVGALRERLVAVVHDAAGLGVEERELASWFESEVSKLYENGTAGESRKGPRKGPRKADGR